MYARGMSVREIRGHLEELYGIDVSADLISAVTDAVLEEVVEWQNRPLDVCFSNRPFRVKHFQTIRRCSVDVAHGLALLFGIGAKALPLWDSRMRWSNLCSGLAVRRNGRSKRTCELTSSIVPRGTSSTARWSSSFLLLDLIL